MSAQAAGRAVAQAGKAASKQAEGHVLNKGAKRDPELYVRSSPSTFHWHTIKHLLPSGVLNFDMNLLKFI